MSTVLLVIVVLAIFAVAVLCARHGSRSGFDYERSDTPRPNKSIREVIEAISKPAVVERRIPRYVCGFAFHGGQTTRPRVVLIRKVKPDWQAGKLNGVGGKIEIGESATIAMAREFREETGVETQPTDWHVFAKMHFPKAQVTFLRYFGEAARLAKTQTVWSDELQREISEQIEHRLVRGIDEIPDGAIMPNLRWAIPLAFHDEEREVVTVEYAAHN